MNRILGYAAVCAIVLGLALSSVGSSAKLGTAGVIELTELNTVTIRTDINPVSIVAAQLELARLDTLRGVKNYPIYLVLDTPGGSIYDGNTFIEYAKTIKNLKTISIFAASMGSAIVQGLPGERIVLETSTLMFHRAKGSFKGQFEDGEVESQLKFWKSIVRKMENTNSKRMNMSLEDYKSKVKDELWIYGSDNVAQNAADRTANVKCSKKLIDARETVVMQVAIFSANVVYSKCPLITQPIEIKE